MSTDFASSTQSIVADQRENVAVSKWRDVRSRGADEEGRGNSWYVREDRRDRSANDDVERGEARTICHSWNVRCLARSSWRLDANRVSTGLSADSSSANASLRRVLSGRCWWSPVRSENRMLREVEEYPDDQRHKHSGADANHFWLTEAREWSVTIRRASDDRHDRRRQGRNDLDHLFADNRRWQLLPTIDRPRDALRQRHTSVDNALPRPLRTKQLLESCKSTPSEYPGDHNSRHSEWLSDLEMCAVAGWFPCQRSLTQWIALLWISPVLTQQTNQR